MSALPMNPRAPLQAAGFVLGLILLWTCAGQDSHSQPTTVRSCGPNCRVLPDGIPRGKPQCTQSADCGQRPHTQRMMCIAGGVCETACVEGWANCNKDYRDGCETPSSDGRCEGDEEASSEPLASIHCQLESSIGEPYDCTQIRLVEAAASDVLGECYQRVLREQGGVEDVVDFAVTVAADGHVDSVVMLHSESSNAALHACARDVIKALQVKSAQSTTIYPIRAVFTSGMAN